MKELLFILLPLFILNDLNQYSIKYILDYLQETKYYEVIQNVKNVFGDDIAIEVCKEYVQTNDCETIVKDYMLTYAQSPTSRRRAQSNINIGLIELLHKDENLKILKKFYNEKDIISKSLKIIKNKGLELLEPDILIIKKEILEKSKFA